MHQTSAGHERLNHGTTLATLGVVALGCAWLGSMALLAAEAIAWWDTAEAIAWWDTVGRLVAPPSLWWLP